jgi:hypothetical protein
LGCTTLDVLTPNGLQLVRVLKPHMLPLWLQFDTRRLDRMPAAEPRHWAAKGRRAEQLQAQVATLKKEICDLKAALKAAPFAQQLQVGGLG